MYCYYIEIMSYFYIISVILLAFILNESNGATLTQQQAVDEESVIKSLTPAKNELTTPEIIDLVKTIGKIYQIFI